MNEVNLPVSLIINMPFLQPFTRICSSLDYITTGNITCNHTMFARTEVIYLMLFHLHGFL
jgi:hypothetical protein